MEVLCPRHKIKLLIEKTDLNAFGVTYSVVIGKCEKCRDVYSNRGLSPSNRRFNLGGVSYQVMEDLEDAYPAKLPVCKREKIPKPLALSSSPETNKESVPASPAIIPPTEKTAPQKNTNSNSPKKTPVDNKKVEIIPLKVPDNKNKQKTPVQKEKKKKTAAGISQKKLTNTVHWSYAVPSHTKKTQPKAEMPLMKKSGISPLDIYTPEMTAEMEGRGGVLPAPQKRTSTIRTEITTVHLASETDKHFWITIVADLGMQNASKGILWSERAICKAIIRAIENKKPWVYYNAESCRIVSFTELLKVPIPPKTAPAPPTVAPNPPMVRKALPPTVKPQAMQVEEQNVRLPGFISALDLINGVAFDRKDIVLYVCKGLIACRRNNHTVIPATGLLVGRRNATVKININYCAKCNKCFISYDEYRNYRKQYKILIGNIRLSSSNSTSSSDFDLAEESPLHLSGYNVSQQAGLTQRDRQGILQSLMEYGIVSKPQIIEYLNFFIRRNGSRSDMEFAVQKWQDDLEWVRNYRLGSQPLFQISKIKKNR